MSVPVTENLSSPNGFSITTETIAKGKLRFKVKIWIDNLNLDEGAKQSVELYEKVLNEYRSKGYKIDGDGE